MPEAARLFDREFLDHHIRLELEEVQSPLIRGIVLFAQQSLTPAAPSVIDSFAFADFEEVVNNDPLSRAIVDEMASGGEAVPSLADSDGTEDTAGSGSKDAGKESTDDDEDDEHDGDDGDDEDYLSLACRGKVLISNIDSGDDASGSGESRKSSSGEEDKTSGEFESDDDAVSCQQEAALLSLVSQGKVLVAVKERDGSESSGEESSEEGEDEVELSDDEGDDEY